MKRIGDILTIPESPFPGGRPATNDGSAPAADDIAEQADRSVADRSVARARRIAHEIIRRASAGLPAARRLSPDEESIVVRTLAAAGYSEEELLYALRRLPLDPSGPQRFNRPAVAADVAAVIDERRRLLARLYGRLTRDEVEAVCRDLAAARLAPPDLGARFHVVAYAPDGITPLYKFFPHLVAVRPDVARARAAGD